MPKRSAISEHGRKIKAFSRDAESLSNGMQIPNKLMSKQIMLKKIQ